MATGDDLKVIITEAREIRRDLEMQPLVDCPVCGTVLDVNNRGEKNCPMGHYRAPSGATKGTA